MKTLGFNTEYLDSLREQTGGVCEGLSEIIHNYSELSGSINIFVIYSSEI